MTAISKIKECVYVQHTKKIVGALTLVGVIAIALFVIGLLAYCKGGHLGQLTIPSEVSNILMYGGGGLGVVSLIAIAYVVYQSKKDANKRNVVVEDGPFTSSGEEGDEPEETSKTKNDVLNKASTSEDESIQPKDALGSENESSEEKSEGHGKPSNPDITLNNQNSSPIVTIRLNDALIHGPGTYKLHGHTITVTERKD